MGNFRIPFHFFLLFGFLLSCQQGIDPSVIQGKVSEDSLRAYTRELSSDEFLGRMPFTQGEERTVDYLVDKLKGFGLEPGNGDSYVQEVPLVDIKGQPDPETSLEGPSSSLQWMLGEDYVAYSEREQDVVDLENSELIFCGYGSVAPEYNWDDFEGLDLAGKTIVVLVNDPGLYSGDSTFFKGETMTYYGRWTYKFEEAARQGAAGVLIVHDTEMAGYPWTVVRNSWTSSQQGLQEKNKGADKCKVQGWITTQAAENVFELAGLDFSELKKTAAQPGFKAIPLGVKWSMTIRNTMIYNQSKNVIAKIPGNGPDGENVIFTAHWDHFGIGSPVNGDSIYNGAIDNATGVAVLMEAARTYVSSGFSPERSIIFLFVTAEEQGLLGSAYYAAHPVYPPESTVANINLDALYAIGPMKDVTMIGYGHSTFDEILSEEAASMDRYVVPDQDPEKGYFFRSDHFNFAKIGIPALYAKGTFDERTKGKDFARQGRDDYTNIRYHQPSDEYQDSLNFDGIVEDAQLFYNIGWRIASGDVTPEWKAGSEFKR